VSLLLAVCSVGQAQEFETTPLAEAQTWDATYSVQYNDGTASVRIPGYFKTVKEATAAAQLLHRTHGNYFAITVFEYSKAKNWFFIRYVQPYRVHNARAGASYVGKWAECIPGVAISKDAGRTFTLKRDGAAICTSYSRESTTSLSGKWSKDQNYGVFVDIRYPRSGKTDHWYGLFDGDTLTFFPVGLEVEELYTAGVQTAPANYDWD
jgi:hypothetical protein